MQKIRIYQIDAFASEIFSGNPAAVCPLNDWLPDQTMQSIAAENNLSETAFFIHKNEEFFIRWFTPKIEIGLCGHATLASAHVLYSELEFKKDNVEFHTKAGDLLKVTRDNDIISMDFPSHVPKQCDCDLNEIGTALGAKPIAFETAMYGLAIFKNEQEILDLEPNFHAINNLAYDGIIVTAPGNNVDFVSRFFGPKLGIPEDPVTGGAHCSLIPYWSNRLAKNNLIARQLSERGVELYCEQRGDRVRIGGRAITYLRGELLI
jgi:PhzF family phenazine biosynthesis protein